MNLKPQLVIEFAQYYEDKANSIITNSTVIYSLVSFALYAGFIALTKQTGSSSEFNIVVAMIAVAIGGSIGYMIGASRAKFLRYKANTLAMIFYTYQHTLPPESV